MKYPATFKVAENGYVVSFRDIPEALTQGDNYEHAIEMAEDALLTSLDFYFEDKRNVPAPSPRKKADVMIHLPLSAATKVALLNTMLDERISQAWLARKMGITPQQVSRLVNLKHTTKIDTIEAAFKAIGRTLTITVS